MLNNIKIGRKLIFAFHLVSSLVHRAFLTSCAESWKKADQTAVRKTHRPTFITVELPHAIMWSQAVPYFLTNPETNVFLAEKIVTRFFVLAFLLCFCPRADCIWRVLCLHLLMCNQWILERALSVQILWQWYDSSVYAIIKAIIALKMQTKHTLIWNVSSANHRDNCT